MSSGQVSERRTQRQRSDQTRTQLLDATITCLIDLGYGGTTTTEVARRAGVSRGAQLHHYPTKAELVVAAMEHLVDRRIDELQTEMGALSDQADEWLDEAVDLLWASFSGPLYTAAVELWVAARTDADLRMHLQPAERRIGRLIQGHVREHLPLQDEGTTWLITFTIHLMRGLALVGQLTPGGDTQTRVVAQWKEHLRKALTGAVTN